MPVRRTLTVSITQEQDDLIRACLASGRYASASEVVRAALRSLERDEVRDLAGRANPAASESRT